MFQSLSIELSLFVLFIILSPENEVQEFELAELKSILSLIISQVSQKEILKFIINIEVIIVIKYFLIINFVFKLIYNYILT
jgi:hypothetical protein